MNNKSLGYVLAVVGAVIIIAAGALAFVIVPSLKVFPDDADTTREYKLHYLTLLDPETLKFAVFAEGENPNLRITRHIRVEEATADMVLVAENQTILDGDTPLREIAYHYALDRKTMEAVNPIPENWADREGLWQREGINIGWGIGAEKRDYKGWSEDYRQPVTIVYIGEEEHEGINVYHYQFIHEPDFISPDHMAVLGLPTELSINSLAQMAGGLDSDKVELSDLQRIFLVARIQEATIQALDLPEDSNNVNVPLVYKYNTTTDYYVEPVTGVLVDIVRTENRGVIFPEEIMTAFKEITSAIPEDSSEYIPPDTLELLFPITVSGYKYEASDASIQDAIADADEAKGTIQLAGTYAPLVLLVLGAMFVGFGVFNITKK